MKSIVGRRRFLKAVGGAATVAVLGKGTRSSQAAEKSGFKKALITGPPDRELLEKIKAAGFDGVEANVWGKDKKIPTPAEAAETRKIAEDLGLRVHTCLRGWARFNSLNPAEVQEDLDFTVETLRIAQGYGADAILLVPGRIPDDGMEMPGKREYSLKFDPNTGHVTQLVEQDNQKYQKLLYSHNHAWDAFRETIPKLIPVAQETGVVVAIENVWNNLTLTPEHFAALIDSFDSPWIRAYFDVANHIAYGPPAEKWIEELGDRIAKVHIKDYKWEPADGKEWPDLREGDVNFPAVIAALEKVGYGDGWLTIEGSGGLPYEEQSRRLDLIIAGS
jgi:hexulose-6-phosphate isomerase